MEFAQKRLEKDLAELKKLIANHFKQREVDEKELGSLKERIDARKVLRDEQLKKRAEKETRREAAAIAEKQNREEEAARKKEEDDRKKKEAMTALNTCNFKNTGGAAKGGRAERERKKKILAGRRKPINVDHMEKEKLLEKMTEMNDYLNDLIEERMSFEMKLDKAKHCVSIARGRVNGTMASMTKKKRNITTKK